MLRHIEKRIKEFGIVFLSDGSIEEKDSIVASSYVKGAVTDIRYVHSMLDAIETRGSLIVIKCLELEQWCDYLSVMGLHYGYDYIDYDVLKALAQKMNIADGNNKKTLVAYGNCQINDYYKGLVKVSEFNKKYDAFYFKYLEYPRWKEERLELLLTICDVLLFIRDGIDKKFRDCKRYVDNNNRKCKCIGIPTYCFRGYFPQTNPHIQAKATYDIIQEYFNSFHREDIIINQLIEKQATLQDIINQVMSKEVINHDDIVQNLEYSLKEIQIADRFSAVKIYDFIKAHYREKRLFKDPVHFEDCLVWFVVSKLLVLLECDVKHVSIERIHDFTELIIYPCVARTLGLEWWSQNGQVELRVANGTKKITIEDYITRYYAFCKNAKEIKDSIL